MQLQDGACVMGLTCSKYNLIDVHQAREFSKAAEVLLIVELFVCALLVPAAVC